MPYPQNLETALEVEEIVRNNGAVPATIAIFNGKCYAGLTKEQLEYFASAKDVWKVSLRDMPYVISKKLPWSNNCCCNNANRINGWYKNICYRWDRRCT